MNHDEAVILSFFRPERRERFLTFARSAKNRSKLRARLAHCDDLDPKYRVPIPAAAHNAAAVEHLLRKAGAGERCFLIAEAVELDGKELPLADALLAIVGSGSAAIVSCIPGTLAFYEGEDAHNRYLLQRAAV